MYGVYRIIASPLLLGCTYILDMSLCCFRIVYISFAISGESGWSLLPLTGAGFRVYLFSQIMLFLAESMKRVVSCTIRSYRDEQTPDLATNHMLMQSRLHLASTTLNNYSHCCMVESRQCDVTLRRLAPIPSGRRAREKQLDLCALIGWRRY